MFCGPNREKGIGETLVGGNVFSVYSKVELGGNVATISDNEICITECIGIDCVSALKRIKLGLASYIGAKILISPSISVSPLGLNILALFHISGAAMTSSAAI